MRTLNGILFGLIFLPAASSAEPRLVEIPAGIFYRGSSAKERGLALASCRKELLVCSEATFRIQGPSQWIYLSTFQLSVTETSQKEYQACVDNDACRPPKALGQPLGDQLPVVGVSWQDARDYCAFIGGRLPSEAEWEKAARGKDGRLFPWGDVYEGSWLNHGQAGPPIPDDSDGFFSLAPVDAFPEGASAFGVLQLSGNVWEWVEDVYIEEAYLSKQKKDPLISLVPTGTLEYRVQRGGSFLTTMYTTRAAYRGRELPDVAAIDVGFRCAR
jgi:formylglycine-generating enzyme